MANTINTLTPAELAEQAAMAMGWEKWPNQGFTWEDSNRNLYAIEPPELKGTSVGDPFDPANDANDDLICRDWAWHNVPVFGMVISQIWSDRYQEIRERVPSFPAWFLYQTGDYAKALVAAVTAVAAGGDGGGR